MTGTINGYAFDTCSHCGKQGRLGPELRAHAITIPGQTKKAVRVLHIVDCTPAWFAKYNEWLKSKGALNAGESGKVEPK